jgi:hypothetical protein
MEAQVIGESRCRREERFKDLREEVDEVVALGHMLGRVGGVELQ